MTVERQQYSAEFKRDAVRMVTESGQSASQLARTLGIHSNVSAEMEAPIDFSRRNTSRRSPRTVWGRTVWSRVKFEV